MGGNRTSFVPWAAELSDDCSAQEALSGLIEVLLLEFGPLGTAELVHHIKVMYGLTFSEREVDESLERLTSVDRVFALEGKFQLTATAAGAVKSDTSELRDRQNRVLTVWEREVRDRHVSLSSDDMSILKDDLMAFLRAICARHGAEVALILYPRNGSAKELIDRFHASTRAALPDREEPLQSIRADELALFLDSADEERRLFIADLLNAWASLAVMTIDPGASSLIQNVAAGQAIYVDTNFVYRLMNLQGPYEYRAAKEILELAQRLGYEMRCTPWMVDEFRQSLRRARDFINRNPILPADLERLALEKAADDDFVAAYWREHRSRAVTVEDFYEFYANIEDLLGDLGIRLVADGCTAVEQDRPAIDYEIGTIETLLFRDRHPAVKEHDAKHRLLIKRLRGGPRHSFSNAGHFYLTCDTLMPRFDREAQRREDTEEVPFTLMASAFLQIVRGLVPRTRDLELSLADIFATPYLRNVGKLSARTTAKVLGRLSQYEGYTQQLAAKMMVNRTFIRAVDDAPTLEAEQVTIDLEIVRAAKEIAVDLDKARQDLSAERTRVSELEARVTAVEEGAGTLVSEAQAAAAKAQAALVSLREELDQARQTAPTEIEEPAILETPVEVPASAGATKGKRSWGRDIVIGIVVAALIATGVAAFRAIFVIPVVEIGDSFDVGDFKYTVESFDCGHDSVPGVLSRPSGEYCVAEVHASNTSNSTADAFNDWVLKTGNGERFDAESSMNGTIVGEVFPGHAVDMTVVFDVPSGIDPDRLVVQERTPQMLLIVRDRVQVALD